MQTMAVDSEFPRRTTGRALGNDWPLVNYGTPFPITLVLPKQSLNKKHTSLRRVPSHTVHHSNHIITYKLLIAWLNITLSRGLVVCNVFFSFFLFRVYAFRETESDRGRRASRRSKVLRLSRSRLRHVRMKNERIKKAKKKKGQRAPEAQTLHSQPD